MTAGNGRLHAARLRIAAAGLAAAGLLAIAAGSPPAAHAEFTLHACEGSAVTGEGSSLQKTAQVSFWDSGEVFDSPLFGCGASAPQITYQSKSSGCGLDTVGAGDEASGCTYSSKEPNPPAGYRDETDRFGASDFAPSPQEEANIDNGPAGAGNPGSGKIHVIPVAGAAIAVVVHFPNGCALQDPTLGNGDTSTGGSNDPGVSDSSGDKFSNQTLRVHIAAKILEEIWQGDIKTWGGVVPKADFLAPATNSVSKTQQECEETPIVRIVRFDTSGTTYNFKAYLSLLPFSGGGGQELWTSSSSTVGRDNRAWPVGSKQEEPSAVNSKNECVGSAGQICKSSGEGGGALANAVKATNGSIGYLDLATARKEGFDMTPNAKQPGEVGFEEEVEEGGKKVIKNEDDRTYWVPLQTISPNEGDKVGNTSYVEPTTEPTAHFNIVHPAPNGANCAGADYREIPTTPASDPTLGDWSKAIATGGTTATAYPVCAITYDLAFDDDAPVYGNTPLEEGKARTVKDYLAAIVNNGGGLKAFDYGILPPALVTDAQTGVAAIGWNKTSGAGGKTEEVVKPPVLGTKTGTTTPTPTPTTPPSNSFSIASGKVKGKNIVLSLVLPGAGKVQIKATGGGVTVSNVTASVSGGQGTATLPISSAALKKLAKSKSKKLSVSIIVTFTPTGGTAATQTKTLTITQASIAGKSKKKKRKKKK